MQRSSSLVARTLANLATIVISLAVTVQPAGAITGREQEDGAHPQTGIFLSLVEDSSCLLHSGSLSAPTADTTARSTALVTEISNDPDFCEVLVSLDEPIACDEGTFFTLRKWYSHPDYVDAEWTFTQDVGVVLRREVAAPRPPSGDPLTVASFSAKLRRCELVGFGAAPG